MNDPSPTTTLLFHPYRPPPAANHMTLNMSQLSFQELEKSMNQLRSYGAGGILTSTASPLLSGDP